jgi:hypothetical protein
MAADTFDLPLRIVIEDPVPDAALALQRGKAGAAELVAPSSVTADAVVFDLAVRVDRAKAGPSPRLLGPYVQGPPDGRFVYVCVGAYAGDGASPWAGRIKVPLADLSWPLIEALPADGRLEGRIAGRSPKGGPVLASVKLLPPGWRPV